MGRKEGVSKHHLVFDTEIIGDQKPCFLVCIKNIETGARRAFWGSKKKDLVALLDLLNDDSYTWVSFNGIKFDNPLLSAAMAGYDEYSIKVIANRIIEERMQPWDVSREYNFALLAFDHIDLIEVAPGVMTSLKTYAGRMHSPRMMDLPFEHNKDLTPKEKKTLEEYCLNDLDETERLFKALETEIALRSGLSEEHGIDLRSKSDAQVAEAILKKKMGIAKATKAPIPSYVTYSRPVFIQTKSMVLLPLIEKLEDWKFKINRANGSPELPEWLAKAPIALHGGIYQVGIGGLHSQHDKQLHLKEDDEYGLSDFDVASYYPNIILKAGLIPNIAGRGEQFIAAYKDIYDQRMEAKRAGNKKVANALKISLNGTFGKLGSIYSIFYSPDLMLAVTLSGQLNLLCLIDELSKIKGLTIESANTDGIMVRYPRAARDKMLTVIGKNAKRTGFEYEETPYRVVAMKDVNNYVAITTDGKAKTKGLYAETGLQKNPTMQICSDAVVAYLRDGIEIEHTIAQCKDIRKFVAIRNIKGGGEQSGVKLGRVGRWYMSDKSPGPIRYVSSGNKVPKTDDAMACMILPDKLPKDLNKAWYVAESLAMLGDMGVNATST